jgi:hypothetical protein
MDHARPNESRGRAQADARRKGATVRRSQVIFRPAGLGLLALAAAVSGGRVADAQYATSIPFNAWTGAYESYSYPIVPNNPAIPNAARYMDTAGGPNQLNNYYGQMSTGFEEAMGTLPADAPDVRGRMVPYTSGYRRFDREFNRVYQPNQAVDAQYYQNRSRRDDLYIRAMTASDPQKRSEALRELREFDQKQRSQVGSARRLEGPARGLRSSNPPAAATGVPRPGSAHPNPTAPERTTASEPMPPTTAAAAPGEVEPIFARSSFGMPSLSPYAGRVPLPKDPNRATSTVAPSHPDEIPPSPDAILERSRNLRVDEPDIPPAPEP